MATQTSQSLALVARLLQEGNYPEACAALKQVSEPAPGAADWGQYCLLTGEARLSVGDLDHDYVDRAISFFRPTSNNAGYAQAKFLKGWQLQLGGDSAAASESLLEAYAAFKRVDDDEMAGRTLNRLAFISLHQGNMDHAVANVRKAIIHFTEASCDSSVLWATINLALICFLNGRISQSLQTYRDVVAHQEQLDNRNQLVCSIGCSLVTAFAGNVDKAHTLLKSTDLRLGDYKREEAQYYEIKGWIALLDKDYSAAGKALKKGLTLSLKIAPESTLISQIKRLYADLYVATSKFDKAEKFANEALEVATKLTERAEIAACHRVFAQVAQHRGDDSKARDEMKQAIDMYSQIGARYELAATRYLAGASGLYRNGERTALLYLAREYFESEDIKHYVQKIDAELARAETPVRKSRSVKKKTVCDCPTIIAVNPAMKKLIEFADHVAAAEMTVLLTGDTGTGKDLMARYIHHRSSRTGPFVPVNAAAVPGTMIESELFGHSKGAFTGAAHDRVGLFEQANEGTFYLNEIADASLAFQAKLLQVLETRTVRRIGDNQERPVSFRLIAATNHDLQKAISAQTFRLDLFHRLNEIPLHLPRLGDRREDIPDLVEYFLTLSGIDVTDNGNGRDLERLAGLLSLLPWPGNVRELKARVASMVVKGRGDLSRMLAEMLHSNEPERERLYQILKKTDWNRSRAAEILGVSEGTVRNRIRKFDLSRLDS